MALIEEVLLRSRVVYCRVLLLERLEIDGAEIEKLWPARPDRNIAFDSHKALLFVSYCYTNYFIYEIIESIVDDRLEAHRRRPID